jgi:25S rRNA (uracil2634-N3)-methyltransferase
MDTDEKKFCGAYTNEHTILVIGDGDFSFSLSICKKLESGLKIMTTSYDSHEIVTTKYPESIKFIEEIQELGSTVLHGVDAVDLRNTLVFPEGCPIKFDRIIFQFPLVYSQGTKEAYTADPDNCIRNRRLIREFFHSATSLLNENGQIHISSKETKPYLEWAIEKLAIGMEPFGYLLKYEFNKDDFPQYKCKNVGCNDAFPLTAAFTYIYGTPQNGEALPSLEFQYDKYIYPWACVLCCKKTQSEIDRVHHEASKYHKRAVTLAAKWEIEIARIDTKWKELKEAEQEKKRKAEDNDILDSASNKLLKTDINSDITDGK